MFTTLCVTCMHASCTYTMKVLRIKVYIQQQLTDGLMELQAEINCTYINQFKEALCTYVN